MSVADSDKKHEQRPADIPNHRLRHESPQHFGRRFQEVIYQRCLAIELERAKLQFAREPEQTIYYEGIDVGTRRADFVVENRVVVELKALVKLEDVHLAQAKNYVVAYDFPLGLLINFGGQSLEYKRLFNPKFTS